MERQNQVESAVRATALYPFLQLHRFATERGQVEQRNRALLEEVHMLTELLMRYRVRPTLPDTAMPDSLPMGRDAGVALPAVAYPGRPSIGDPDVFLLAGPDLSEWAFPVGVFTGVGLVGVARAPHGRGASGEFWSHADFRVSVVTEDGSVSGIVRAIREDGQALLLLEGAPFQADVPAGTLLLTTGIGAVHPAGVPVGRVREPADSEAGWMKRYAVEPAVRPETASDVFIWQRPELPAAAPAEVAAGAGDTIPGDP